MSDASASSSSSAPPPISRGSAWKIVATVIAVTGATGSLLFASMKPSAEYYKHVDEVLADIPSWRGKRLQVHGNVVDGSIEQAKGTMMYRFKIETGAMSKPEPRPHAVISATYTGLVPDTFKSGAEVVVKGTLTGDNAIDVVPDGIMAKCPSKYNADEGGGAGKKLDPAVAGKI
jgi:cytochrome c-type biogenesis protein CcmE